KLLKSMNFQPKGNKKTFSNYFHLLRLGDKNPNQYQFLVLVWNKFPKIVREWWAIPGSNQ
ncbi:hypothetical protein, partial [Vibrio breoganii]|uniref:hypothetical protein n=1 Tax=Vibrio breoganii TaxID=553239 RepID=UPI001A7E1A97